MMLAAPPRAKPGSLATTNTSTSAATANVLLIVEETIESNLHGTQDGLSPLRNRLEAGQILAQSPALHPSATRFALTRPFGFRMITP